MCIGIFSFRAFDRRLARLAAPISSGVRQGGGGQNLPPPPAGRVRLNTPAGRGLRKVGIELSQSKMPNESESSQSENLSRAQPCSTAYIYPSKYVALVLLGAEILERVILRSTYSTRNKSLSSKRVTC